MKFSRYKLQELIKDLKPDRFTWPKVTAVVEYIAQQLNILPDEQFKDIIKYELMHYKRSGKKYGSDFVVFDSENFEIKISPQVEESETVEDEDIEDADPISSPKRRKSLLNVTRKTILRRTNAIKSVKVCESVWKSVWVYETQNS